MAVFIILFVGPLHVLSRYNFLVPETMQLIHINVDLISIIISNFDSSFIVTIQIETVESSINFIVTLRQQLYC